MENGKWISYFPHLPETWPIRDGTWVMVKLYGRWEESSIQFDPQVNRWFDRNNHMIDPKSIMEWFCPSTPVGE